MTARRRTRCVAFALALFAASAPASAALYRTGQPVMGTVLQVTVIARDDATARALADAAVGEARRWDDILTTWRSAGELARLNAQAGAGPVMVGADLSDALRSMQRLSDATGGAFDPAVGPLVDLWRGSVPPSPQDVGTAPYRIADALTLHGRHATLAAGAKLDAGGIGKGMALDAAGALLRARGVQAAYLDFGGSSQLAIGAPPGSPQGWRVAVSGLTAHQMHGVLTLRDAALSTSRAGGAPTPAGPIIDPRNGRPVAAARLTTVRARDATTAEAWSKAVIILGHDGMQRAVANGVDVLLDDPSGLEQTPGFHLEPNLEGSSPMRISANGVDASSPAGRRAVGAGAVGWRDNALATSWITPRLPGGDGAPPSSGTTRGRE
jgi:thiamine biosynthesis lipoprotein